MLVFVDVVVEGSSSSALAGQHQQSGWPAALFAQHHLPHDIQRLHCDVTRAELRSSKARGSTAAAKLARLVHSQNGAGHAPVPRIVLVSQGFGGHLVKEVCLQLQHGATSPQLPAWQRQQYACTLSSVCGLAFYSTPHKPLARLAWPEYEYVLPDMPSVCQRFRALCKQQGWKTLGIADAAQAKVCGWVLRPPLVAREWWQDWVACNHAPVLKVPSAPVHV